MKVICLVLFLALSMPGCSMFSKGDRQNRAYRKYVKKMTVSRERQRRTIRQRAEMPALRNPAPSPVQENIQTSQSQ